MKKKVLGSLLLGAMLASVPAAAMAETVTINLGNPVASVDADTIVMQSVAGISEDGVILVPVRDVAEAFGGTVVYTPETNQVKLSLPNGQWAEITVQTTANGSANGAADQTDGIVSVGTFVDDKLYIPADLMATCLGARLELIDYGQEGVYRLIYHVR